VDDKTFFRVKKILDHKSIRGVKYYHVDWDVEPAESTWEPRCNLTSSLLQEYRKSLQSALNSDSRTRPSAGSKIESDDSSSDDSASNNSVDSSSDSSSIKGYGRKRIGGKVKQKRAGENKRLFGPSRGRYFHASTLAPLLPQDLGEDSDCYMAAPRPVSLLGLCPEGLCLATFPHTHSTTLTSVGQESTTSTETKHGRVGVLRHASLRPSDRAGSGEGASELCTGQRVKIGQTMEFSAAAVHTRSNAVAPTSSSSSSALQVDPAAGLASSSPSLAAASPSLAARQLMALWNG
jgi:hypothetical protein